MLNSKNFINGIIILQKYFTERTAVVVIEISTIAVEHLNILSDEDAIQLHELSWNYNSGFASYHHLEYVDT